MTGHIAAIQLNSSNNMADNLKSIDAQVTAAKADGADMVLLPENCAYMATVQGDSRQIAEVLGAGSHDGGAVQATFASIAQKHNVWLFVGGFPTKENDVIYQTLLVYDNQGTLVTHYHKRHLFDVTLPDRQESYRESDVFSRGDAVKTVDTPWGRVGLAICYDLRFPEHFRALIDAGAELIVLPAAFTYATGKAHWEVLLRARAIENQCWVLAAAQSGKHPGDRDTWGHSMIINSWGEVTQVLDSGEGWVIDVWDKTAMAQQRRVFPTLQHRRK